MINRKTMRNFGIGCLLSLAPIMSGCTNSPPLDPDYLNSSTEQVIKDLIEENTVLKSELDICYMDKDFLSDSFVTQWYSNSLFHLGLWDQFGPECIKEKVREEYDTGRFILDNFNFLEVEHKEVVFRTVLEQCQYLGGLRGAKQDTFYFDIEGNPGDEIK